MNLFRSTTATPRITNSIKCTLVVTPLVLGYLALSPGVQAKPPPKSTASEDRGNGNSAAEGVDALNLSTTGSDNTAHGWFSLFSNTTGYQNTATGGAALGFNTVGSDNTANGFQALLNNTTASGNTAVGAQALLSNTTASGNTAVGAQALQNNTTGGTFSTTLGYAMGPNVAVGALALGSNTTASANTAVGYQALGSLTTGLVIPGVNGTDFSASTAVGFQALANATDQSSSNSAFGYQALASNTTGSANSAFGFQALGNRDPINGNPMTGGANSAFGYLALANNASGGSNIAVGFQALYNNESGNGNVAIGTKAGYNIFGGSGNVAIGDSVTGSSGVNVSNTTWIRNVYYSVASTRAVYVDSDNKIGTLSSSRRYKEEIKPMDKASEALFALKPVSFRYKKEIDPARALSFGLIAEEVAQISPDLITCGKDGRPETVRYEAVNAMLLNEFLKEHRRVEQQETIIAELKSTVAQQLKGMEALAAHLKEQATQIQKVSAQLELSKPSTQTVANTP
jgi:trimeric autotransporter adhesin